MRRLSDSRRSTTMRALLAAALCSLAAVLAASTAAASTGMQIGLADDDLMQKVPGAALPTAKAWQKAGVSIGRVTVVWSTVTPEPHATRKPAGFDGSNPDSPGYHWGKVDGAVDALIASGIKPVLVVTAPMPVWASEVPSRRDSRYKPDPQEFGAFAAAVAKRYGNRVDDYIVYNEPNIFVFLTPQWSCKGSRCTLIGPGIYRSLVRAAYPAIKAADPGSKVWGGAMAPGGGGRPTMRSPRVAPLTFLRGLGCVDSRGRRDRRSAECRRFKPATLDGIAHHPHSGVLAPNRAARSRESATVATMGRFIKTVDRVQRAGGITNGLGKRKKFDIFVDEYGIQTNPPDKIQGVSTSRQNTWLQQASYLLWRQPRVKMLAFYLWHDEPMSRASTGSGSWQSGLYYHDGRPKPAARTFEHPFWVELPRRRRTATVWGQVRPGNAHTVTVERRRGRGGYRKLRTLTTNSQGYFSFRTTVRGKTSYRFSYVNGEARTVRSSTRTVR